MLEDQASDAALAAAELRRADVRADFKVVSHKQAFIDALLLGPDLIIADYAVPGFGGPDALKLVRARGDDIPFIIFSGTIGEDRAVEMIKAGATDYVLKDRAIRLPQAIRQALENRRLRQQQIAAEKALRATIESALDCIVTIDEHGTVLEFNPAAEKTFGWSRAEALDHPLVYMIIPARDRESYLGALKSFLETGEPAVTGGRHEIRAVRQDGTEFPMEIAVSRSGSGRPALFTVFMRDISERFAAEEKLRAQEEQYRVLFESSPNAMWVYDLKGLRILAVNHAAEVQYGYTREEFLRLTLLELRPREDREKVTGAISAEGAAARYAGTWTHLAKGGRALLVDVYSSPTTYEGIPARMAVLVDVTEQKGAENALRQSELSLANAQRIAQLGNWDWNLETGELRWSQQVFEVFGIARDEFDHSYDSFLRHVHADDRTNVDSAVQAAITGDAVYDLDHRILRRDGSVRTVHENGEITRDATGRAIRMAGTVQDITDRKVADQAFYESQEKYRNIVETANEGIWVLDAEGLTTYANQQLTTMLGYSAEEMRGRPIFDFVFHDSIARAGDDLAQRQAGSQIAPSIACGGKMGLKSSRSVVPPRFVMRQERSPRCWR
jgi:PAS domain S-box-containing protein